MPKAIVAIGGGQIRTRGTAPIDREIIRLSQKKNPRLLFIPTASSDSEKYWKNIQEYFGDFLKCETDVLFLIKEPPSPERIRSKILSADIIYVGGGNTLQMMRIWRRLGLTSFSFQPTKTGLCSRALVPVRSVGLMPDIPIRCLSTTRENGNTSK
jgi:dipeptidase E